MAVVVVDVFLFVCFFFNIHQLPSGGSKWVVESDGVQRHQASRSGTRPWALVKAGNKPTGLIEFR